MGNLPVVQEVGTGFQVVGDCITGQPERARERVGNYFQESVVGSFVAGAAQYSMGNYDNANEYFKGCGRATGKAVLGGGFMRDVPVFHELAVCGECLGDVIGGGDIESADKRWDDYVESSVIGGGIATVKATLAGDRHRAAKLAHGVVKAGKKFAVAGIGVGAVVATGGIAVPYGIAATLTVGATAGAVTGAASTAATQVIDKGEVDDIGAVVGNGLFGGVLLNRGGVGHILVNNAAGVYHRNAQDAKVNCSAEPSSAGSQKAAFATYQDVPPHDVTAKKLITNFLRYDPIHDTKNLTKDIVVVMDGSGSIGDDEFEKGKTALRNMIGLEREGGNDTNYASVIFSNSATVTFSFVPYTQAANEILMIPYPGGGTNTQAGLTEAKTLFEDPSKGVRDEATRMVFLVTDGHSNINEDLTIPKADELKNIGVQIFVVAVGGYIDGIDELVKVASTPPEQFLFRVESLGGFLHIVQLVIDEIAPGKYAVSKEQYTPPS